MIGCDLVQMVLLHLLIPGKQLDQSDTRIVLIKIGPFRT